MSVPVGVLLVGIGGYGRSHLASIAACRDLGLSRLHGVTVRPQDADAEAEAALEADGAVVYRDFGEMLAAESARSSLVAIPAGIPSHRSLTVAALEAGYHVLCEKPVAGCLADALAMRDARDASGRTLAIGYQYLYSKSVQMLKAARVEGRWGRLLRAKGVALWPRGGEYYRRNEWAGKITAGGAMVYDSPAQNAVSHYLQLMLYIAGMLPETSGDAIELYGENYRAKPIESADTQFLRAVTDSGVDIKFWCSHAVRSEAPLRIRFIFERAEVEYLRGGTSNGFSIVEEGVRKPFGVEESDTEIRRQVFTDTFEAMAAHRAPLSSIDNAIGHTRIIETLFTRCAPIVPVSGVHSLPFGEGTDATTVISGLDELALECFERELGYSEAKAPWAKVGASVRLA